MSSGLEHVSTGYRLGSVVAIGKPEILLDKRLIDIPLALLGSLLRLTTLTTWALASFRR